MMVRDLFNQFHTVFENKQENAVNDASSIGLLQHFMLNNLCFLSRQQRISLKGATSYRGLK